jgi:hypothetical protein
VTSVGRDTHDEQRDEDPEAARGAEPDPKSDAEGSVLHGSFFLYAYYTWLDRAASGKPLYLAALSGKSSHGKGPRRTRKNFFCVLRVLSSVAIFFSQNGAEKTRKLAIVITEKEWTVSSTNQGL